MKKSLVIMVLAAFTLGCNAQKDNTMVEFGKGDIKVTVEQGTEWLHDFPLFLGIKKKNAPQIAIWTEDMDGRFLSTIYVTEKLAKQSWMAAGGNRRKESLPCWSFAQGKQYADGLYLPTRKDPLPDAFTGATPKGSFVVKLQASETIKQFVIRCEFNHSVDFNEHYPKTAKAGESNFSGGKMGSGQPAVIYEAIVDLVSGEKSFKAKLIGHSSPDGSDGKVYTDVSKLTTALQIVKDITIYFQ